ncbi:MAG: hypothetical protein FJY85_01475 [Deltaproteobacteria bacterium]|nr:hypothetical protein [Deltaproteobacteria bacterium]
MLKLMHSTRLGRPLRQDDWPDLGIPTRVKILEAIEAARLREAKDLVTYLQVEGKLLHDMLCDYIWGNYTQISLHLGEVAVYRVGRAAQEAAEPPSMWEAFIKMSVEERVYVGAEILRSHYCGPRQDGTLEIIEEPDRISIQMDPCGSGGRMRRGDPAAGTPSRLGPPYNFGVTKEPHPWSWGKIGVPYYCAHCAVNEILAIEWVGFPPWVTGYNEDHQAPCSWHFYKKPELIPEEFFSRLGLSKP